MTVGFSAFFVARREFFKVALFRGGFWLSRWGFFSEFAGLAGWTWTSLVYTFWRLGGGSSCCVFGIWVEGSVDGVICRMWLFWFLGIVCDF